MATLERNHSFQMGLETTYADGGASFTYLPVFIEARPESDVARFENPVYVGSLSRNKFWTGQLNQKVTAKFYLKGAGSVTAPELDPMLKIAGLQVSASGNEISYYPADSGHSSATILVNLDGVQYTLSGSRIDALKIPMEAGSPVTCEASIMGLYTEPSGTALVAPTFANSAVTPPVVQCMSLTIGGQTHRVSKFELNLNNNLVKDESVNACNRGIAEFMIVGRDWEGTATIERDDNNDIEYWSDLVNSTELAVASVGFGTVSGNQIGVSFTNMQIEDVKPIVVNQINYYEVKFRINDATSLKNEFTIAFK